jgi:hypothetical protein
MPTSKSLFSNRLSTHFEWQQNVLCFRERIIAHCQQSLLTCRQKIWLIDTSGIEDVEAYIFLLSVALMDAMVKLRIF